MKWFEVKRKLEGYDDDLPEWYSFDYLGPPPYEGTHSFFPDSRAQYAIDRAETDPEQAADALRIVAAYLRRGEALPYNLASYLADAIEASVSKPVELRARILCKKLHLKQRGQPTKVHRYWEDVGRYMSDLISYGATQNDAKTATAEGFGIGDTTAVSYYKQYTEAMAKEAAEEAEWQANFARTNPEEARREAAEIEEAARMNQSERLAQKPGM